MARPTDVYSVDSLPADQFERKYVHEVYEAIAPHFSHTRFSVRGIPTTVMWSD